MLDCHYTRLRKGEAGEDRLMMVEHDGSEVSLLDTISKSDIIINGTFQDPDDPMNFILESEKSHLKPGSLIIDISCDEGMGFYFAKPTTFKNPMIKINKTDYYAVDHTPSYLWESASRSISAALVVHLPTVIDGRGTWLNNKTISRAVNINAGVIVKPSILSFQNRQVDYPHAPIS